MDYPKTDVDDVERKESEYGGCKLFDCFDKAHS